MLFGELVGGEEMGDWEFSDGTGPKNQNRVPVSSAGPLGTPSLHIFHNFAVMLLDS